jgi:hypothetical protein
MARKILLLEMVGPSVTTLTPLALATKGTNGSFANSNFDLQATAAGGAWSASVTGTFRATSLYYFEALVTGQSATRAVAFGIATSSVNLNAELGADINAYSFDTNSGVLIHNSVTTATGVTGLGTGAVLMCAVDLSGARVWFGANGVWFSGGNPALGVSPSYTGLGGLFSPAVSVFKTGDNIRLLTDPALQNYQAPAGFTAGWASSATVGGSNYYFASEGFTTSPTDTPANQYYDPRITADGDPIYDRTVSCAVWDNANTSNVIGQYTDAPSGLSQTTTKIAIGDITLNNTDGALDAQVLTTMRDGTFALKLGYYGNAYTTFVTVATGIIDSMGGIDEHNVKMYARGKMAKADKAAQSLIYDARTSNQALEGSNLPVMLGRCNYVPLVTTDPANLEYEIADAPFGEITEMRDQGILITQGSGWDAAGGSVNGTLGNYGLLRLTNPAGRQCVSGRGKVTLGASAITASNPFTFTGGLANGWTKVVNANTTATQSGGSIIFACTTGTGAYQASLTSTSAAVIGQLYYAEVTCSAYTSGQVDLIVNGVTTTAVMVCKKTGTFRFSWIATSTTNICAFEWGKVICNLTISGVTVNAATAIERLPAWLTELLVTRGGLSAGDLDTAGTINALDTIAPYLLNFYCQDATRIPDIIKATMDSFCGWIFEDRLGVLKVGQLAVPSSSPILTLTDTELVGDVVYRTDSAQGFSTTLSGLQNYSVHSPGDIASSLYVPGTGDPVTAAKLQEPWLVTKKGNGALNKLYNTANLNTAMVSLLSSAFQVATEANRRVGLFNVQRGFYEFSAVVDDTTSYTLNPGDTVNIQTVAGRYGTTNGTGKNVLLVGVKSRFLSNRVDFLGWA